VNDVEKEVQDRSLGQTKRDKDQWRRHIRACRGKCPARKTSALATALAVKNGNNKIIYQDILTALADATNGLPMPCHEQRTGAAIVPGANQ